MKDENGCKPIESGILALGRVEDLVEEADELMGILNTRVKNAR